MAAILNAILKGLEPLKIAKFGPVIGMKIKL
jgi:hypothetical protein